MLGRAVLLAAGTLLINSSAIAQTTESPSPPPSPTKAEAAQSAPAATPDPLTPPEAQATPPAAPGAPVLATQPPEAEATADAVVLEVRKRLSGQRTRESSADAADRAALTAHYQRTATRALWTNDQGFSAGGKLALEEIGKADDWGLRASAFELPVLSSSAPSMEARADAEIKLGLAILKYARHARGGRLDPQSVSKLFDRKPQLFEPASLIAAVALSQGPDAYLRGLHPKHAGFRNLQKALHAARHVTAAAPAATTEEAPVAGKDARRGKSAIRPAAPAARSDTIQRIVANMERWRWMPDDLGAFHVWNNIPEQLTSVYKDGKVVFHERIVVGKPDTPTPNFSADMQFVIFQPEWGVPGGIKNNEIGPMLKRASADSGGWFSGNERTPSTVLARHGLRVSVNGQAVNPDSINWSQVDVNRFSFIQPAGPQNVLGVVKFRFPNKHDVYMHDTPQKDLFGAGLRAFSHGCMRVQNPVRFAEVLLEHDKGWASDRVRGLVPRGGEVKLTTQIPVHNVYFTATADEDGKVRTHGDLYGADSRIASALEGRSVAIASRGEPAAGGPEGPAPEGQVGPRAKGEPRQARRAERPSRTASQGFNPFAGLFGN